MDELIDKKKSGIFAVVALVLTLLSWLLYFPATLMGLQDFAPEVSDTEVFMLKIFPGLIMLMIGTAAFVLGVIGSWHNRSLRWLAIVCAALTCIFAVWLIGTLIVTLKVFL